MKQRKSSERARPRQPLRRPSLFSVVLKAARLDIIRSVPFMPIYSAAEVSLAFLAAALIRLIYLEKPRIFVGDIVPTAVQQVVQFPQSVDRKDLAFAIPLIIIGVGLVKMVSSFASTYFIERSGYFVSTVLREELLGSLLRSKAEHMSRSSAYELTNRVIADSSLMQGAVSKGFLGGIRDVFVLIFCFSGMLFVGGKIIVVLLLFLLPFALVVRYLAKVLQRYQTESAFERVKVASHAMDSQAALLGLAAERETPSRLESYRVHTSKLYALARSTLGRRTLSGPFIEYLAVVGVAALLAFKNTLGDVDLATYASLFILGAMTYRPLKNLGAVLSQVTEVSLAFRRLEALWRDSLDDETNEKGPAVLSSVPHTPPCLARLRCVSYRTEEGKTLLEGVNLEVRPGEVLGFVGESGSGKTTALRLLAGVLRPFEGELEIHGHVRLATQRATIFAGSLLENVDYEIFTDERPAPLESGSHGEGSDGDRLGSAKGLVLDLGLAGTELTAGHFLERRTEPDGGGLSGGEKARVALARVLQSARVRPSEPLLLLFDEPTANLDETRSELFWSLLRKTVARSPSRVAAVVVTHHLQDLSHCDRAYAFAAGSAIERGLVGE